MATYHDLSAALAGKGYDSLDCFQEAQRLETAGDLADLLVKSDEGGLLTFTVEPHMPPTDESMCSVVPGEYITRAWLSIDPQDNIRGMYETQTVTLGQWRDDAERTEVPFSQTAKKGEDDYSQSAVTFVLDLLKGPGINNARLPMANAHVEEECLASQE